MRRPLPNAFPNPDKGIAKPSKNIAACFCFMALEVGNSHVRILHPSTSFHALPRLWRRNASVSKPPLYWWCPAAPTPRLSLRCSCRDTPWVQTVHSSSLSFFSLPSARPPLRGHHGWHCLLQRCGDDFHRDPGRTEMNAHGKEFMKHKNTGREETGPLGYLSVHTQGERTKKHSTGYV